MCSAVQARPAKVAPVTRTDSPSAMMTNRPQRSAMWPPSTCPVGGPSGRAPAPRSRAPAPRFRCRPRSPTASAGPGLRPRRRRSRTAPSRACQTTMRMKLRKLPASWFFSAQSMNRLRPTCVTANANANGSARSSNAFGIDADRTSPASISANSISRTAVRSGSSQLVIQAVSIQAHHTASISTAVCNAPSGVRCSSRPCESCVTANTNTRSKNSST